MPSDINHYAISKILGSKIKPIKQARFGSFALLETTAEILRARDDAAESSNHPVFGYAEDKAVVQAFEDVRQGAAPDAILWDKELAGQFYRRCRELGLVAPNAFLGRRLFNVRKHSPRYRQHGIELSPATKRELQPSILPQYAHVIEFALVRMRYRYGVSIDDILLDPGLSDRFEELTAAIAPDVGSRELRLGALYIRKRWHQQSRRIEKIKSLDTRLVEKALKGPVALAAARPEEVPPSPGLIEIREAERYLYISHNENIRSAVDQIRTGRAFAIMAGGLWKPDPEIITLQFAAGEKIGKVGIEDWERRLIHDLEPVFNWPMQQRAA